MKIAKDCKSWILSAFIPALIMLIISVMYLQSSVGFVLLFVSVLLFLLTGFFLVFFRDPQRKTAEGIVACADGKIREIKELIDKDIGKCFMISTFMNIQNVHVNRMIFDGKIKSISHFSGFHLPAFKKESEKNERIVIIAETSIGLIKIVQIAGTLARRIVPYIKKDDFVKKGKRIGIIRLGSRVDVYLPSAKIKNITVRIGCRVKAGEDKIAEINA
jgi:phosphatidylserine decarboxylase